MAFNSRLASVLGDPVSVFLSGLEAFSAEKVKPSQRFWFSGFLPGSFFHSPVTHISEQPEGHWIDWLQKTDEFKKWFWLLLLKIIPSQKCVLFFGCQILNRLYCYVLVQSLSLQMQFSYSWMERCLSTFLKCKIWNPVAVYYGNTATANKPFLVQAWWAIRINNLSQTEHTTLQTLIRPLAYNYITILSHTYMDIRGQWPLDHVVWSANKEFISVEIAALCRWSCWSISIFDDASAWLQWRGVCRDLPEPSSNGKWRWELQRLWEEQCELMWRLVLEKIKSELCLCILLIKI